MINYASLPTSMRKGLWAETSNCVVLEDNTSVHKQDDKSPYFKLYHRNAPYVTNMHPFGDMGTVLDPKKKIKSKLTNK